MIIKKLKNYARRIDITKNKNDAAIMGHEIAHAVAKHSEIVILNTTLQITDILTGGKVSINRTAGMDTLVY